MERIRTVEAIQHVGQRVRVQGWLQTARPMGGITFLILRDGWGTLQIVAKTTEPLTFSTESVLSIEGVLCAQPRAPGGVELIEPEITVVTPITEPTPVTLSKRELKASLPTLLDHAPIVLRHPTRRAVFKLSAAAMAGFRQGLEAHGFTEIQTPKIVASATESGANVFALDYFGTPAYLAQSPQFYKQTMVGVFERVFEVGPVFRAEPHSTTRHINQYVSLDVEVGFIENHTTVMRWVEVALRAILATIAQRCPEELELLGADMPEVPETIPQIHFRAAKALLAEHQRASATRLDLTPEEERWLGEWAWKEHQSAFLFVVGYPMAKRPFYTHPNPKEPTFSNSFDLLFRGTELITGGQRLHRYADYQAALQKANLPEEPFLHYLEAFRFGMPPHGGFAIGLERLLMQLLAAPNLRLTTLFPRDMHRLAP
ncbi:MAG: aspartate--tRNA(Asn) ligase [Myxococcota bacterium]